MLNKAQVIGHLGKDPEAKYLQDGKAVCNFSIATTERWTKDGQKQEKTEWHNVSAFGKLAEICTQYLRKGSLVYVEGKLQTRKWEKDGQTHYSTSILANEMKMLGGKQGAEQQREAPEVGDDLDDDIPF